MAEPTYDDVIAALRSADASGNTDDARRLAQIASTMKQATEKPATERLGEAAVKGYVAGGLPLGMPSALAYMGAEGLKIANEKLTKGAYDAGGKITDIAAGAGASPQVAAGAGFLTNVGIQAVPSLFGMGASKSAAPMLESSAQSLMKSALKPPLASMRSGKGVQAIQTMLDEGINVSPGGVAKLKEKISSLNTEIAQELSSHSASVVDKSKVWNSVKGTLDKFKMQVNPNADVAKIRAAWDEFLNHPMITGDGIPVELAQKLKQGTYRVLDKKYGQLGSAETEAQKALARGLKEEISSAVPAVAGLNAQESKLIGALNLTERRVFMEANKNPLGLSLLAHDPVAWASFMADRSGLFKSLIARMLHSGAETIPQAVVGPSVAAATAQKPPQ